MMQTMHTDIQRQRHMHTVYACVCMGIHSLYIYACMYACMYCACIGILVHVDIYGYPHPSETITIMSPYSTFIFFWTMNPIQLHAGTCLKWIHNSSLPQPQAYHMTPHSI